MRFSKEIANKPRLDYIAGILIRTAAAYHPILVVPYLGELVRLKDIMDIGFELLGKQVVTANKEKVGKVVDFATELSTMYVQKLYVGQSLLKNLAGGNLGIDRGQIVEITDKRIIVQSLQASVPASAKAWA